MYLAKIEALYRAITKREIPTEYQGLKVIGRGNTSIILEKDPETAVMLTRDSMKKDWLHFGIGITKDWKTHDIAAERHQFKNFPVFAIEMPKLYPLGPSAKIKLKKEFAFLKQALKDLGIQEHQIRDSLPELMGYYEDKGHDEHSIMYSLFQFLSDYHPEQWSWDMGRRQFAQDSNKNLILVDPIVDAELRKQMFSNERHWN